MRVIRCVTANDTGDLWFLAQGKELFVIFGGYCGYSFSLSTNQSTWFLPHDSSHNPDKEKYNTSYFSYY